MSASTFNTSWLCCWKCLCVSKCLTLNCTNLKSFKDCVIFRLRKITLAIGSVGGLRGNDGYDTKAIVFAQNPAAKTASSSSHFLLVLLSRLRSQPLMNFAIVTLLAVITTLCVAPPPPKSKKLRPYLGHDFIFRVIYDGGSRNLW